jgi:N-methylhydantoinase B
VSNVEDYEARFPLLYPWRRHEPDTGGPGRWRGGVGVGFAVTPHGVDQLPSVIPHFAGTSEPESSGLEGGYPGATNGLRVVRHAGFTAALADGRVAAAPDELRGPAEPVPGVAHLALDGDDVLVVVTTGGGGWGDPLDRDPADVALDVRARLVTATAAAGLYGVVTDRFGLIEDAPTEERRLAIRRERARAAGVSLPGGWRPPEPCPRCRRTATTSRSVDGSLPEAVRPLAAAGPHVAPDRPAAGFVLIERYCPGCFRLVDVERVARSTREVQP